MTSCCYHLVMTAISGLYVKAIKYFVALHDTLTAHVIVIARETVLNKDPPSRDFELQG